jgi:hypothetical protein
MLEIAIAMVQYVFIIGVLGLTLWALWAALLHFAFEKGDEVQDKVDAVFEKMDAVSDQMDKARRGRLLRQLGFPRHRQLGFLRHQFPIGLTMFAPGNRTKASGTLRAIEKIAAGAFNQSKGGE